jgi:hypothetical protein
LLLNILEVGQWLQEKRVSVRVRVRFRARVSVKVRSDAGDRGNRVKG